MSPNIRLNARTYLGQEKFVAKYPTITGFYQKPRRVLFIQDFNTGWIAREQIM